MYRKIHQSILTSSIAANTPLRRFFQDLILLADPAGEVIMTPEAIARGMNTNQQEVDWGLAELQKPDPRSRNPDHEGRRIEPIDGLGFGWRIINFKYHMNLCSHADRREYDREYAQKRRESEAVGNSRKQSESVGTIGQGKGKGERNGITTLSGKPDTPPAKRAKKEPCQDCGTVVDNLNQRTGRDYRNMGATATVIHRRHTEFSVSACLDVTDWLWVAWKDDDRMRPYLRPDTIFNGKFAARYEAILAGEKPPKMADTMTGGR